MFWLLLALPLPLVKPPAGNLPLANSFRPKMLATASSRPRPSLSATSYLVVDYDTGQWLASKQPRRRLLPASLTKMVTALVVANYFPPNEWLTVYQPYPVGQTAHLAKGTAFQARDLISIMLVHSANDAAFVLADNYRRQTGHSLVDDMNRWLKKYQLLDTHFVNFDGEEDNNHYSTAADMAKIARIFLENNSLRSTVRQRSLTVYDRKGNEYLFNSTDDLLAQPGYLGVKTGWTEKAGGCFAALYDFQGRKLISVVLQSRQRFIDTQKLLAATLERYHWRNVN